jgi:hypothetical protein
VSTFVDPERFNRAQDHQIFSNNRTIFSLYFSVPALGSLFGLSLCSRFVTESVDDCVAEHIGLETLCSCFARISFDGIVFAFVSLLCCLL